VNNELEVNGTIPQSEQTLPPPLQAPERKKPALRAGFSFVGDRGLLATTWLALRAVAHATFSRFARVEPLPPEVLILIGFRTQKACSKSRLF
jgi:hypothetical protein